MSFQRVLLNQNGEKIIEDNLQVNFDILFVMIYDTPGVESAWV